jgi:hypothetical protein
MTTIEVIDTAIKIGLSAAIGGLSALFIGKMAQAHEIRKERMRRKQDSLEDFSRDFEIVHSSFLDRCTTPFYAHSIIAKIRNIGSSEWDLAETKITESKMMMLQLHQLEGRLLLFDLQECAKQLKDYRVAATMIEQVSVQDPDIVAKLRPTGDELCRLKATLYASLAKEHKGS